MSKVTVFDIEEGLPLYVVDGKIAELIRDKTDVKIGSFDTDLGEKQEEIEYDNMHKDIGNDEDPIPEWVKLAAKTGWFGEMLALEYLSDMQSQKVNHVGRNAKHGYDIEVMGNGNRHAYEVKTTTQQNNKFHITHHELQVAYKMQDFYHIMFIKIDNDRRTITGFIIDNPIKTLDIDFADITKISKCKTVEITANRFVINLSENLLNILEEIILNKYIDKVKNKS